MATNFKLLAVRRRNVTIKSHLPGQPSVQAIDGIEVVLDYIPKLGSISPEEEKEVVDAINRHSKVTEGGPFLTVAQFSDSVDQSTEEVDNPDESVGEVDWKTKYENTESKRRGLQLKVNEYKKKLEKYEGKDKGAESTIETAS